MSTDANEARAQQDWERWREARLRIVAAPYGPLSVTGTHWIAEAEPPAGAAAGAPGRIPGLPGEWAESAGPGEGDAVLLTAGVADGVAVDDELLAGSVRLGEDDESDPGASRVSYGERRLVLMRREGQWAVRVFDPDSAARRDFAGIAVFPYDPRWVSAGTFRPYEGGGRSVRVGNADGRERGLGLAGELAFSAPDGTEHTLQVSLVEGGRLWAVFADGTSGRSSYRFRFLRTEAPAADGAVAVDLNRATLPPCAFTDSFLCPFPPPGNRLGLDVEAGESLLNEA